MRVHGLGEGTAIVRVGVRVMGRWSAVQFRRRCGYRHGYGQALGLRAGAQRLELRDG